MCFFLHTFRCTCALLLAGAIVAPARAVVISAANDTPNLMAPGNDPGWNNVGRVSGGSGVYLGNRWVITANHVSNGALKLSDGRTFSASVGSELRLSNAGTPTPFGTPDLRMFRLAADPGLPALAIAPITPAPGELVIMIGAGVDRGPELLAWQTFPTAGGLQWNEAPLPVANQLGHPLLATSAMRWGANFVDAGASFGSDQTFSFHTRFDRGAHVFEAQAALGDSGGGVFHETDGGWQLAGIMTSTGQLSNQPANTVVYGVQTIIADLSFYRTQIMDLINRAEPLWQNQVNRYDVSSSATVTPRDVLLLINELQTVGPHELTGAPPAPGRLFDVNGDYRVTTSDVQQLINHLLTGPTPSAASPASGVNFVPEPGAVALVVSGLFATAVAWGLMRRPKLRAR